jgi:formylglycine-generating enzyme required for sulfatase activity
MGLPSEDFLAEDHEKPARQITLSSFWIDIYPVTNARYRLFMEAGGYEQSAWWHMDGWKWRNDQQITQPLQWDQPGWDGPDQPVAGVSWFEAEAYARWAGRRLPTDAEWEKAARGVDVRRYPWGNDWPNPRMANFDNVVGRTTPVGLYPDGISPYGCYDMAGNVNNWTSDWYHWAFGLFCSRQDNACNPTLDDAQRAEIGDEFKELLTEKVDRGGGFATPREHHEVLGCTRKTHWTPDSREPWNGFRTAMDFSHK